MIIWGIKIKNATYTATIRAEMGNTVTQHMVDAFLSIAYIL